MCVRSGLIILLGSHWWNDHGTVVFSGFSFTALPNKSSKKYIKVLNKRKRKKEVPGSNFYPSCIADSTPPPIVSLGSRLWISPPSRGPGSLNHTHLVPTPGRAAPHLHMEGSPLAATCPKTCNTRRLGTPARTQGSPLAGHTPSTTHRWLPYPWAGGPHPFTEGTPLACRAPSTTHRRLPHLRAWRAHPHIEGSPVSETRHAQPRVEWSPSAVRTP